MNKKEPIKLRCQTCNVLMIPPGEETLSYLREIGEIICKECREEIYSEPTTADEFNDEWLF